MGRDGGRAGGEKRRARLLIVVDYVGITAREESESWPQRCGRGSVKFGVLLPVYRYVCLMFCVVKLSCRKRRCVFCLDVVMLPPTVVVFV